jgi:Histidine kinase-, DNA gyrase B-, and HSP90-like ATPase
VTTGEAVVAIGSGHTRGEPLALGDVVNTASRLQSSAPRGRLVVDEETNRATREALRYDQLEVVAWAGILLPPAWREKGDGVRAGAGIGLSLVARFAELHGGRAWVEDRPGGGAAFRVLLPGRQVVPPAEARVALTSRSSTAR